MACAGAWAAAGRARSQSGIDGEIRRMAAEAPLRMRFEGSGEADCRAWQARFASKLRELLGPYQPPAQWDTLLERSVDLDDHRR